MISLTTGEDFDMLSNLSSVYDKVDGEVIDIKYQVSVGVFSEEQVFCFSAMIVYCLLYTSRCV